MDHFEWALSVSNKRLRASSLGVYRSMWGGLERRLAAAGAPGPTQCDASTLAKALMGAGDYGTQRRLFRLVKWVCETLGEAGLPVSDACSSLERLYRADVRPLRALARTSSPGETVRVLRERAPGAPGAVALAALCEATGMKTAQLRALSRADVELDGTVPSVRWRGRRQERTWVLPQDVSDLLEAWLRVHPCSRPDAALFATDARGEAPASSTLWRQLKRVSPALDRAASTPGTGLFRARLAARMRDEGASPEQIREALGHRQLESTLELLGRVCVSTRQGPENEGK